jgi:hypothetical protein
MATSGIASCIRHAAPSAVDPWVTKSSTKMIRFVRDGRAGPKDQ